MLLGALSTSHAVALGVVALAFIVFALVCALVIPRYRPDFPGENGLKLFLGGALVLFVAMLAAVELFAAEPKEAEAGSESAPASTAVTTAPSASLPTSTSSSTTSTSTGAGSTPVPTTKTPEGDAVAGKGLYKSLGCVDCHTLDGTKGTGPTFKGLSGSQVKLNDSSTVTADDSYLSASIADPDAQIVQGFQPGIMSSVIKKGAVSDEDIRNVVAFIDTQK